MLLYFLFRWRLLERAGRTGAPVGTYRRAFLFIPPTSILSDQREAMTSSNLFLERVTIPQLHLFSCWRKFYKHAVTSDGVRSNFINMLYYMFFFSLANAHFNYQALGFPVTRNTVIFLGLFFHIQFCLSSDLSYYFRLLLQPCTVC
jgi:hypothetical protein